MNLNAETLENNIDKQNQKKQVYPRPKIIITQNQHTKILLLKEYSHVFKNIDLDKSGIIPILISAPEIRQKTSFYYDLFFDEFKKSFQIHSFNPSIIINQQLISQSSQNDNLQSICNLLYSVKKKSDIKEFAFFSDLINEKVHVLTILLFLHLRLLTLNSKHIPDLINDDHFDMSTILTNAQTNELLIEYFSFNPSLLKEASELLKPILKLNSEISISDFLMHFVKLEIGYQKNDLFQQIKAFSTNNKKKIENRQIQKTGRKKYIVKNFQISDEEKSHSNEHKFDAFQMTLKTFDRSNNLLTTTKTFATNDKKKINVGNFCVENIKEETKKPTKILQNGKKQEISKSTPKEKQPQSRSAFNQTPKPANITNAEYIHKYKKLKVEKSKILFNENNNQVRYFYTDIDEKNNKQVLKVMSVQNDAIPLKKKTNDKNTNKFQNKTSFKEKVNSTSEENIAGRFTSLGNNDNSKFSNDAYLYENVQQSMSSFNKKIHEINAENVIIETQKNNTQNISPTTKQLKSGLTENEIENVKNDLKNNISFENNQNLNSLENNKSNELDFSQKRLSTSVNKQDHFDRKGLEKVLLSTNEPSFVQNKNETNNENSSSQTKDKNTHIQEKTNLSPIQSTRPKSKSQLIEKNQKHDDFNRFTDLKEKSAKQFKHNSLISTKIEINHDKIDQFAKIQEELGFPENIKISEPLSNFEQEPFTDKIFPRISFSLETANLNPIFLNDIALNIQKEKDDNSSQSDLSQKKLNTDKKIADLEKQYSSNLFQEKTSLVTLPIKDIELNENDHEIIKLLSINPGTIEESNLNMNNRSVQSSPVRDNSQKQNNIFKKDTEEKGGSYKKVSEKDINYSFDYSASMETILLVNSVTLAKNNKKIINGATKSENQINLDFAMNGTFAFSNIEEANLDHCNQNCENKTPDLNLHGKVRIESENISEKEVKN